jgi:GNAT superfamily N-acetyltransferase
VTLRDGSEVRIRPIRADDKAALLRGFERLSPESRYRRFLTPMTTLNPRMLRYLTEIDHHSHEALVAEAVHTGEPVGVARYICSADDRAVAEVAVAVVDDWQGRGAATELLRRLEQRAVEEGIERFVAICLAGNREVLELLAELGPARIDRAEDGVVNVEIALPATREPEAPLRSALRHAASGALDFRPPRMMHP